VRRLLSIVAAVSVGTVLAVLPAGSALAAASSVTGLAAAPGEGQVSLSWVNPVSAPLHVVVREAQGSVAPHTVTEGTDVPLTSATTAVATGLAYGTHYSFSVFTSDGTTTSAPTSVTSAPSAATTMSIGLHPSVVVYGTKSEVSGRLRRTADQAVVAGEKITLFQRAAGSTTWVGWAAKVTDADGIVRFPVSFGRSTQFKLVHGGDVFYGVADSKPATLKVNPKVSVSAPSLAKTFDAVKVTGKVSPATGKQTVYLQRYVAGWKTVLATKTNTKGVYTFTLRPTVGVVYQLRTYLPAGSVHASALSAKATVTVGTRDLVQGMSGPDVLALQQRLAALHYDTGAVNGTYSYDTSHAVTAFEKEQGLTRDGIVSTPVRTALAKPKVPVLHFHDSGRSFEVDKTHQVVIMGFNGQVQRIIDSSTGFGGSYVYAGVTYQALTPDGTFHIERKINGWRTSHLGTLYRPAYFYQGWAIHGEGLVPNHPASHGCVRITVPAMDRLYDLLTIGTPVHIYG
jgi:N-acetylmuramoyl-L-alanine amidase